MNINQANSPEKSEPAVSSTTPDEQLGTSPARTYECTFCKRGFSNAQALGGHMNIHRKDKAKLKQANEPPPPQQQQFLELPKMISSDIPTNLFPQSTTKNTLVAPPLEFKAAAAGDHQERSNKWTWNFRTSSELDDTTSRSSDHPALKGDHQLRQLPLFTETLASNPENQKQPDKELAGPDDHDLDLELRLGHEPSESSSAAKGTRKFF